MISIQLGLLDSEPDKVTDDSMRAIDYMKKFEAVIIASPNRGDGAVRTCILAKKGKNWFQIVKIWGITKSQTLEFANNIINIMNEEKINERRRTA